MEDLFCPRHGRASRPVEIPGLRCDCAERIPLRQRQVECLRELYARAKADHVEVEERVLRVPDVDSFYERERFRVGVLEGLRRAALGLFGVVDEQMVVEGRLCVDEESGAPPTESSSTSRVLVDDPLAGIEDLEIE